MATTTKRRTTNDQRPTNNDANKITISISVSPFILGWVKEMAKQEDRTVSWMAQKLMHEAIDARNQRKLTTKD